LDLKDTTCSPVAIRYCVCFVTCFGLLPFLSVCLYCTSLQAKTATIVLRGGGEQFIEEAERSLHDAIMIVRRARKTHSVVAGGGAIEVFLISYSFPSIFIHDSV
jgi:hypothetical protein